MIFHPSHTRNTSTQQFFSLLFIAALLFAAQHLVMHDVDAASAGPVGHYECQLNHVPCAQLPILPLERVLLVPDFLLATQYIHFLPQSPVYPWRSRAPPLN